MSKILFSIVIALGMSNVYAEQTSVESQGQALFVGAQCPQISSDYQKAITNLKTITNSILNEAGCENLVDATARLKELVEPKHKAIYQTMIKKKGEMLSAKAAAELETYATKVSQGVANVFDLLEISDCPVAKEKKSLIYKSLLSLSFDAISGMSELFGPYGAPLSVGLTALKGVMNGVGSYSESSNGYKFNVSPTGREEAVMYTKSLCVFYNFKKEADVLLNASDRKDSYLNLLTLLNRKINTMMAPGYCNGCETLVTAVNGYEKVSPLAKQLVMQINSQNGLQLGDHLLDALQTKIWVQNQVNKLEIEELEFNESIGPAILGAELEILENFIVYRESGDFLDWIHDESKTAYKKFKKDASAWVAHTYYDLERANRDQFGRLKSPVVIPFPYLKVSKPHGDYMSLYDYKEHVILKSEEIPQYSKFKDKNLVEAKYNKSIKILKTVNRFISSYNEYCNFFKLAGYYDATYNECHSRKMTALNEAFLRQSLPDPELSSYLEDSKDRKEKIANMSNQREEWGTHISPLFQKWDEVNSKQQIYLMNR